MCLAKKVVKAQVEDYRKDPKKVKANNRSQVEEKDYPCLSFSYKINNKLVNKIRNKDKYIFVDFSMIRLGDCASEEMTMISNIEDCESAARILNLKGTTAEYSDGSPEWQLDLPQGCIYNSDDDLLYFESSPATYDWTQCGRSSGDSKAYNCICKKSGRIAFVLSPIIHSEKKTYAQ